MAVGSRGCDYSIYVGARDRTHAGTDDNTSAGGGIGIGVGTHSTIAHAFGTPQPRQAVFIDNEDAYGDSRQVMADSMMYSSV